MCETDADCPDLELCYYSTYPWNSNGTNVCGCNSWFGWTGDDCKALGPGSDVVIVSASVTIIMGVIGAMLGIHTLLVLFEVVGNKDKKETGRRKSSVEVTPDPSQRTRLSNIDATSERTPSERKSEFVKKRERQARQETKRRRKNKRRKKLFTSMNFTSALSALGMLFYLGWRIAILELVLTPDNVVLREEDNIEGEAKAHRIEVRVEPFFIVPTGIFLVLSLLNLSLVWIDNVQKIQKLTSSNNDRLLRYKKILVLLNLIWIVGFSLLDPALVAGLIVIFLVMASVSYVLAVHYIVKLYKSLYGDRPLKKHRRKSIMEISPEELRNRRSSMMGNSYWLEVLLQRMSIARRRIVIGSVLAIVGALVYLILSVQNSWREYSEPGQVSFAMVGNELMSFGIGFNQFAAIVFLHDTATRPVSSRVST